MIVIPEHIKRVTISNSMPHNHERLREEEQASVPAEASLYQFLMSLEVPN